MLNKNGIPVQTKENAEKRRKMKRQAERIKRMQALEDKKLGMKRFALINDEAEVEVVVPHFSPIVEEMLKGGWREVFEKETAHPDGLDRLCSGPAY